MTAEGTLKLHLALRVVLATCIVVCLIGPLAVWLHVGGGWLFFWPPAFALIRGLTIFVFPAALIIVGYFTYQQQIPRGNLTINAALIVVLALVVWVTETRSRVTARESFAKEYGNATPAKVFNRPVVGTRLPTGVLTDMTGDDVEIYDQIHTTQVAMIVFFMAENAPWSDSVKEAKEIYETMAHDGVIVIGINEHNSPKILAEFVKKHQISFPVLRDPDGSYFRTLNLFGSVEQMLVVDGSGKILAHRARTSESVQTIKQVLQAQLKR